jgi:NADH:ubiquinone oxidoreductase subunit K
MTSSDVDKSQIRYARLAGFMYLFVNFAYALGLFITSGFRVPGNFTETAHRIMESELLYRIGLSSLLIGGLCTVFLAMGLYGAVKPIDNNLALLGLVFRLVEATLFGVLSIFSFGALKLYIGGDYMRTFDQNQLSVLVNLSSVASSAGFNVASIFFSMGSVLFFYLFFKANYIPRILSILGLFGSVLMSIVCFASLLSPQHAKMLQLGWLPIAVAEILVGLWLLFKGVSVRPRAN